jgi:hypothetical protein
MVFPIAKKSEFQKLVLEAYNPKRKTRNDKRVELAEKYPSQALNEFIKRKDYDSIEFLIAENDAIPIGIRRNAYIELGMLEKAEKLIPEPDPFIPSKNTHKRVPAQSALKGPDRRGEELFY